MSSPRSVSAWWALLLLVPLGLGAGQLIGRLPVENHTAAATPASTGGHAATGAATRADAGALDTGAPSTGDAAAAPAAEAPAAGAPAAGAPASGAAPTSEAPAGGGLHWRSFTDAVDESRRTGKPVMLDFNADWCGPCQRMKAEVFESPSHARAIEAAVLPVTLVDRAREMGANPSDLAALQQRFQIRAFPTLIVISPATGKATKQEGYMGDQATEEWITQAAQAVASK